MKKPEKCMMHSFRIFNDVDMKGTGFLTFYCEHCLALVKIKKAYEEIEYKEVKKSE